MFMIIMCSFLCNCLFHTAITQHLLINQSKLFDISSVVMDRLTPSQRREAIGMLKYAPVSDRERFFGTSRKIHLLQTRNNATGSVADRPRSGRPKVTTDADAPTSAQLTCGTGFVQRHYMHSRE